MAQETLIDTIKSDLSTNSSLVTVRAVYKPREELFLACDIEDERMKLIQVEDCRFWVAPTNPIAPDNVKDLNRFLDGITSQEPRVLKPFYLSRGGLKVGRLRFRETLMTQRVVRTVEIVDLQAVKKAGLLSSNLFDDKIRSEAGLRRRNLRGVDERHFVRDIVVYTFPNTELARLYMACDDVLDNHQSLPSDERGELKNKLYSEIINLRYEIRPKRIKAINAGQDPFPEISKIPELQEALER